ncbi:hypothetical protein [Micromonospora taraxaci]|uniref:hypothetical protein n=1 Tax=Micromonospora taraxaci TaxID=1316803 RepID=UPI0033B64325
MKLGRLTAALTRAGDDLTALLVRLGSDDLNDGPADKARKAAGARPMAPDRCGRRGARL